MLLLKCYKYSEIVLQRYYALLQIFFRGFWLGVLSSKMLHKIDELYYDSTQNYYSIDYNKRGLRNWEAQMIETYFEKSRHLLLIGAGGGREAYALQKMGYSVEAFECNVKLLEFGNKFLSMQGLEPCIKFVERDQCPAQSGQYEGAIIGWGAYMLIQGRQRRVEFLRKVRLQLKDASPVLLSFFTRHGDSWKYKAPVWIANVFRVLLFRETLQIGDSIEPNYVHYFTEEEMFSELEEAGFKPEYYSNKGYGHAIGTVQEFY